MVVVMVFRVEMRVTHNTHTHHGNRLIYAAKIKLFERILRGQNMDYILYISRLVNFRHFCSRSIARNPSSTTCYIHPYSSIFSSQFKCIHPSIVSTVERRANWAKPHAMVRKCLFCILNHVRFLVFEYSASRPSQPPPPYHRTYDGGRRRKDYHEL